MTIAKDQEAAEKIIVGAKSSPQALKREHISTTYGTTEVVPFPFHKGSLSFFRSL